MSIEGEREKITRTALTLGRLARRIAPFLAGGLCLACLARDSVEFPSIELYSVRIIHLEDTPLRRMASTGNAGIFIGNGLVLTAAHVARGSQSADGLRVQAAGRLIAASIVKIGSFEKIDAALLAIAPDSLPPPMRSLPPLRLCDQPPVPGTEVLVAEPGNVSSSVVVGPDILPKDVPGRFNTLIRDVDSTGNSGAALFDKRLGCLMGIMSARIDSTSTNALGQRVSTPIAKYFVPAVKISSFLDLPSDR
jgi:hypothetical protein